METRSGAMASWPSGWGFTDPAAIPPPGLFQMQRAGVPVTAHTALQVDTVFTCLRVISNAINDLGDLHAYTDKVDKDNIPYRVREKVQPPILEETFGPFMMQYDGRQRTAFSLGLFGEAFWHILERDKLKYPTALEVLHPAFMKVELKPGASRPTFEYGTGVNRVTLDPDDVLHIPFKAMPGATRGLSSIEYAGVEFAISLAAREYGARWFSQGASPSFLLSTDQKIGSEELERLAQKFLVDHSGLQSSHLPLVVDSGLKVEKLGSTPDEAQYIQTLEHARSCVAAWFGLPSHLVGGNDDRGNVWGKTIQEQTLQFLRWTLSGYLVPLEEAHSRLLPSGVRAAFDRRNLTVPDAENLSKELLAVRQTQVMTINDVRARYLHLPPVADPAGDQIIAPLASNTAPDQTVPQPFGAPGQPAKGGKLSATPAAGDTPAAQTTGAHILGLELALDAKRRDFEHQQEVRNLMEMARTIAGAHVEHDEAMRHALQLLREQSDEHLHAYRDLVIEFARQHRATIENLDANQAVATRMCEAILETSRSIAGLEPVVNVHPAEIRVQPVIQAEMQLKLVEDDDTEAPVTRPKVVRRRTPALRVGGQPRMVEKVVKRRKRRPDIDPEAAVRERYREELFAMARTVAKGQQDTRRVVDALSQAAESQLGECRELLQRAADEKLDVQALVDGLRGLVTVEAPVVNVSNEAPVVNVPAQEAPVVNVAAPEVEITVEPSDVYVMPADQKPKRTKVLRDPRTGRITGTETD